MLGGFGIKSVARLGPGVFKVDFTEAFDDNKFGVAIMSENNGFGGAGAITASIGGSRGGIYTYDNYMVNSHIIVETRRAQSPTPAQDYNVIVNIMFVRNPGTADVACGEFTSAPIGDGFAYAQYVMTSDHKRKTVYVENGFTVGSNSGIGQNILWNKKPASHKDYSVAATLAGGNDGRYMGLEGYGQSGSYNRYYTDKFAVGARKDGNGNAATAHLVSILGLQKHSGINDKKLKMVTFASASNIMTNVGVQRITKKTNGLYQIEWASSFQNEHYAVFGIANMWCSGGSKLHVADSSVFKQTAGAAAVTSSYPYRGYIRSEGSADTAACMFYTVIAIGD